MINNLISTLIGALIAIMIMLNGSLSNILGKYTASTIVHGVGTISILIIILLKKSKLKFKNGIPLYLYLGGAIGVFTVVCNSVSFVKIGASLTLSFGLLGQSITSILIDNFGLLGSKTQKFRGKKFIGLATIVTGIIIMTIY